MEIELPMNMKYLNVMWMAALSLSYVLCGENSMSYAEDTHSDKPTNMFDLLPGDAALKLNELVSKYTEDQHISTEKSGGWDLVFEKSGSISWYAEYPDGICVNFYPNGYPESFTRLKAGQLIKEMKKWDDGGHLITSVKFMKPQDITYADSRTIWGGGKQSARAVQHISNRTGSDNKSHSAFALAVNVSLLPDDILEKLRQLVMEYPQNTCFRDSDKNGFDLVYYDNKKLSWYAEYNNNLLDGMWVTFHANGTPRVMGMAVAGKLVGELKIWDANGELVIVSEYHKPAELSECMDDYLPPHNLDNQ